MDKKQIEFLCDEQQEYYLELKENPPLDLKDKLKGVKSGLISIYKQPNGQHIITGFIALFGIGLRAYITNQDDWYSTNIIDNIDWDEKEFTTHSKSTYSFNFKEYESKNNK